MVVQIRSYNTLSVRHIVRYFFSVYLYDARNTSGKLAQTKTFPPYARNVPISSLVLLLDYRCMSRGGQANFSTAPQLSPTVVFYLFSSYLFLCQRIIPPILASYSGISAWEAANYVTRIMSMSQIVRTSNLKFMLPCFVSNFS